MAAFTGNGAPLDGVGEKSPPFGRQQRILRPLVTGALDIGVVGDELGTDRAYPACTVDPQRRRILPFQVGAAQVLKAWPRLQIKVLSQLRVAEAQEEGAVFLWRPAGMTGVAFKFLHVGRNAVLDHLRVRPVAIPAVL